MLGPILTSIPSKRELLQLPVSVHVIVELEQKGKTCAGDEVMGRFERNVELRDAFGIKDASRYQVFLDGIMRELHHLRAVFIHNVKQAGAGRHHDMSSIFQRPAPVEREASFFVRCERKKIGELFDTKRTASNQNALEEAKRILPTSFVDVLQCALIRPVQRLGYMV
jgi:hypothetical protein